MVRSLSFLLVLGVAAPAPAAEPRFMEAGAVWLEAYGGGHFFLQGREDFGHTGVAGGRIGVNFIRHFGLEVGAGIVPTRYLLEDDRGPAGRNTLMANPRLDLTFHLVGVGPFLPYLQAGVGFKYYRIGDVVPGSYGGALAPSGARPQPKWHEIDLEIDAAVGFRFFIVDRLGLDLNFRYLMSDEPGQPERFLTETGAVAYDDRFDNLELTLGLFGVIGGAARDFDKDGIPDKDDRCREEKEDKDKWEDEDGCPDGDNDQDGIADAVDKCPDDAEDSDGWQDEDGCPDADNDQDGIADTSDKCPDDAEDKDGFEDEDGCPDLDNDKDGIADAADKCPSEAENYNRYEDEDGCPEPDTDGDKIPDPADKCVDKPETMNGFEDKDGCPDELPKEILKFTGVIQGINFEVNSDKLTSSSNKILDATVAVMTKFPELRLEVQGHTSAEGDDAANMDLSQRRAASVVAYLVGKGIEANRLFAKGYGETKPIAKDDAAGRKKNRRVEFVIVPDDPSAGGLKAAPVESKPPPQ